MIEFESEDKEVWGIERKPFNLSFCGPEDGESARPGDEPFSPVPTCLHHPAMVRLISGIVHNDEHSSLGYVSQEAFEAGKGRTALTPNRGATGLRGEDQSTVREGNCICHKLT